MSTFVLSIINVITAKTPEPRGLLFQHPFGISALRSSHASSMRLFVHRIQNQGLVKKESHISIFPLSRLETSCRTLLTTRNPMTSSDMDRYVVLIRAFTTYNDIEQRYTVDLCDLMQTMKLDASCEKGVRPLHLGSNDF
jgi:hypothetical protein